MYKGRYSVIVIALGLALSSVTSAGDLEDRIALAKSAAPASVSADATVIVDGEVVVEGSNGWICMPDTMPSDGAAMCNDKTFMQMMQAIGTKAEYDATGIGFSYMLQGDIGAGVSNATPYHPDPKNADDYTETGPHLMIVLPKAMLQGITTDPSSGGPYVMWGETPYAHIMIPVGE